jgi:hypothetical protein
MHTVIIHLSLEFGDGESPRSRARHLTAFFRAALALVGAALAMVHLVLPTLSATGFADVGTDAADLLHEL